MSYSRWTLLTYLSWIRASCFIWLTFPQFVRETSREVSTQLGGNSCWFPWNAPSTRTARTAMLGGVIVFLAVLTQLDREKISQTSLFVIYQLHSSANTKLRMSEVVATWLFGSPWFQWTVWKKGCWGKRITRSRWRKDGPKKGHQRIWKLMIPSGYLT